MAILSAREIWEGRAGKIDEKGHRSYTREFRVTTDADTMSAGEIILSPLFPRLFTPYIVPNGFDTGALLKDISASQDQGEPTVWKVKLEYSTRAPNSQRHPGNPNPSSGGDLSNTPFDRPPLITWDAVQYQKPLAYNLQASAFAPLVPITNSAGERFDPPIMIDDSRIVLIYERNEPTYSSNNAVNYRDAVNSDQWNGFSPGTVKCGKIGANLEYEKGWYYWKVRYEFHIRDTWQIQALDHGRNELTTDAIPVLKPLLNNAGHNVDDMLDGSGHKLPYTATPSDRFKNAHFLTFTAYNSLPFGPLQIIVPG